MILTFAIARDAPVGVVIANWGGRLSRIYRWDLETDVFTAGQFVKARASVEDISHDGRYVAYYCEAFHRPEQAYIAVSHLPYFTALAFFPTFYRGTPRYARFRDNGDLDVGVTGQGPSWSNEVIGARIEAGCPFRIVTEQEAENHGIRTVDPARNRRIRVDHASSSIYGKDLASSEQILLHRFERLPFEEVAPPDWATRW